MDTVVKSFSRAVKTTFSVSLSISDDQPTQEEGKPHQFAFDVNGQWKIECAGQAVDVGTWHLHY